MLAWACERGEADDEQLAAIRAIAARAASSAGVNVSLSRLTILAALDRPSTILLPRSSGRFVD